MIRRDPGIKVNILPNVNPSAGETNLVPYTEKAPDTGNIEDISPLYLVFRDNASPRKNVGLTR